MVAQAAGTEEIARSDLEHISDLRDLYKRELNGVVAHEGGVLYGSFELFLVRNADWPIGYGIVARGAGTTSLIEFFLLPAYRAQATPILDRFLKRIGITHMIANTHDQALTVALYDYCADIAAPKVLFADQTKAAGTPHDLAFRKITPDDFDTLFPILHRLDWYPFTLDYASSLLNADLLHQHRSPAYPFEVGREEHLRDWIAGGYGWLLHDGRDIVGIGAIYEKNKPFVDLAMMVREPFQHRGYGTQIIQHLKAVCYDLGLVPTAKCFAWNVASRRTLQRAGFAPNGRLLVGTMKAAAIG